MIPAAGDLLDRRGERGNVVLTLGRRTPNEEGAVVLDRGDGVGRADDGLDAALRFFRDLLYGEFRGEAGVDDGAVIEEEHIGEVGDRRADNMAVELFGVVFDLGEVVVAPCDRTAVIRHDDGELVGGVDLLDAEVVAAVVGGELRGKTRLAEAVVAPGIDRAPVIERQHMVRAGRDLDDLRVLNLFGHFGEVDDLRQPVLAPDIDVTVLVRADGEVVADGDIRDTVLLELRGDLQHGIAGGDEDEGGVLFAEVERDEVRRDEDEESDDD